MKLRYFLLRFAQCGRGENVSVTVFPSTLRVSL